MSLNGQSPLAAWWRIIRRSPSEVFASQTKGVGGFIQVPRALPVGCVPFKREIMEEGGEDADKKIDITRQ